MQDAKIIIEQLRGYFPEGNINFDLEDCDKILRVENAKIDVEKIIDVLHESGYEIEVLF